jgi:phenylacetate-coenzyme A ligase PaaK-like adenylate-forming protein
LGGCRIPFPTVLQDNDFSPAAESVARLCAQNIPCLVSGPVSPAVRLASAALDRGWDIAGTLFLVSGESLTDAKRAIIERSGGTPFARYGVSELGFIGHGCRQMTEGDCVHLYGNAIAAIAHRRTAPLSDTEVDSLFYTTLLSTAPLVLINFEVDDSGRLEQARCDCEFSGAGLHWCIRDIFSFGKMTGHGVTLIGTDLLRLLEDVLPARLGGRAGDYQLLEREGAAQTQLELRVSPRVQALSVEKLRQCFLDEVRQMYGGTLAGRIWRHAEAVEVVLAEPISTASGKVHSLHLLGNIP